MDAILELLIQQVHAEAPAFLELVSNNGNRYHPTGGCFTVLEIYGEPNTGQEQSADDLNRGGHAVSSFIFGGVRGQEEVVSLTRQGTLKALYLLNCPKLKSGSQHRDWRDAPLPGAIRVDTRILATTGFSPSVDNEAFTLLVAVRSKLITPSEAQEFAELSGNALYGFLVGRNKDLQIVY